MKEIKEQLQNRLYLVECAESIDALTLKVNAFAEKAKLSSTQLARVKENMGLIRNHVGNIGKIIQS
jgi:hypothetical protein